MKEENKSVEILSSIQSICETSSYGEAEYLFKEGGILIGVSNLNDEETPFRYSIGFPLSPSELPKQVKHFRGDL